MPSHKWQQSHRWFFNGAAAAVIATAIRSTLLQFDSKAKVAGNIVAPIGIEDLVEHCNHLLFRIDYVSFNLLMVHGWR